MNTESRSLPAHQAPTPQVDAVQREVMTNISPDGRPPPLDRVRMEWKWFLVLTVILAAGAIIVLFVSLGVTAGLLAVVLLAGYIGLTVPVWGAGLLRGREERVAKDVAETVVSNPTPRG